MGKPLSSRQLHLLATNPRLMLRYRATGRVPDEVGGNAQGAPLYRALQQFSPRDLSAMGGVRVGHEQGLRGPLDFAFAAQLVRWLESPAAASWVDWRRQAPLSRSDILQCCSRLSPALRREAEG